MKAPGIPANELQRIATLESLKVLDTPFEERFDRITRLAKRLFGTDIALVVLVDRERQWFKSCVGLSVRSTSREVSFCGHAILGTDVFVVADARQDARFSDNPLVTGSPHIRFYAGCPLTALDGTALGTLCVIDPNPREFSQEDKGFLKDLATTVEAELENRKERMRADALAELARAKIAFFGNVSHEFRTPLTLMLGPTEDALRSPGHSLSGEALDMVHRNALRLMKLVNSLLDFSRLEAGRTQVSFEPMDLAAQTVELASVFGAAVERAGLTLTVECPALPEALYVDREMWEKIVLNLLSNALKHTFDGGIRIALRWCEDHAELSVSDSGVGIPESELPHLFDRFHRVQGAKSRTHEGTGIGLALVQELVQLHGGTTRVESREGVGSTFTVTIKVGSAHLARDRIGSHVLAGSTVTRAAAYVTEALHWSANAELGAPASADLRGQPSTTAPSASRYRILWADDNADMREYVRRLLAERYDVTAVSDGETALVSALASQPDLVLSDVMMPGLDGFGLLRELRANERTRTIPVILLSARAGEESAVEGLDAGADDYVVKPFSARELLARVRTHVEMAALRREWAAELAAANKELEAFSHAVSHDLRTPLRAMHGFSSMLLRSYSDVLDARGKDYLNQVRAAVIRMSDLVEGLARLSSVTRGGIESGAIDLTRIAEEILEELRAREPGRKVEFHIERELRATGDGALIRIVLENLLGNAWKYSRDLSPAIIEFAQGKTTDASGANESNEAGGDAFYIRDNGAGFSMEYADKLFQPFQRLHTPSEFEGTGIGLATAQRIVERHGGSIWANAEVGRGATFYFTLKPRPS